MSNKNQFMDLWDLLTDEPGSIFSILLGIDDAPVCVLNKTDRPALVPCQGMKKLNLTPVGRFRRLNVCCLVILQPLFSGKTAQRPLLNA